jgi:hypothetical protein
MNKYMIVYGFIDDEYIETYFETYTTYEEAINIYNMYKIDHSYCYLTIVVEGK